MNIQEAKEEIVRSVKANLARDEAGMLRIPRERQRPILLMGPPGIGKTAIMRQTAEELGINLVSYTITHHTRQSAIGLPKLTERVYGGERYTVTEYTMSEIVSSVYDQIERSGIREGILFLDEINCVSETLAPTMLQFLQYKTFGTHAVPEGFVIVTAGNPPEYNRSVREFDLVTLDRLKVLNIEADYQAWKTYAVNAGVHAAVTAFLELKKDCFFRVRTEPGAKQFVTPRAWEDLSDALKTYELLELPVSAEMVGSYVQDRETAGLFYDFYRLWQKFRERLKVGEILSGRVKADPDDRTLREAPFDEKLSLILLLSEQLAVSCGETVRERDVQRKVFGVLRDIRDAATEGPADMTPADMLLTRIRTEEERFRKELRSGLFGREEERARKQFLARLRELSDSLSEAELPERKKDTEYQFLKERFTESEHLRASRAGETGACMERAFAFLADTFGEGQEMVLFLKNLSEMKDVLIYVRDWGNEAYRHYNRLLLLEDRREEIRRELLKL